MRVVVSCCVAELFRMKHHHVGDLVGLESAAVGQAQDFRRQGGATADGVCQ